jgi:hypothetical protein
MYRDNWVEMAMIIRITKANIGVFAIQAIFITIIIFGNPKADCLKWKNIGPMLFLGLTLCVYLVFPVGIIAYTLYVQYEPMMLPPDSSVYF